MSESQKTKSFTSFRLQHPPTRSGKRLRAAISQRKYFFGRRIESDWKVGSVVRYWKPDGELDVSGVILECDPPFRVSFTWTVEWSDEFRNLPETRVTFLLEPVGEIIRLTMTQTTYGPLEEKYLEGGRRGWPVILSGLKTLLETGNVLPIEIVAKQEEEKIQS